jgi:hypothetical protein
MIQKLVPVQTLVLAYLGAAMVTAQPMVYSGGPIVPAAKIVVVYLGTPDPSFKTMMDTFYQDVGSSQLTSWLSEYSAGLLTIMPATLWGSVVIPYVVFGDINTLEIGATLDLEIHHGLLPDTSDANIIYMVHVAPSIQVYSGLWGIGKSPGDDWCAMHLQAYGHGTGRGFGNGGPIIYAVLPSMTSVTTCWPKPVGQHNAAAAETWNASHELVELITDPGSVTSVDGVPSPDWSSHQAWIDPIKSGYLNPSEIADVCESATNSATTVMLSLTLSSTVASAWSNMLGGCFVPNPGVALMMTTTSPF